jgi:hypothetical protein
LTDFYDIHELKRCELLTEVLRRFSQADVETLGALALTEDRTPEQIWAEICRAKNTEPQCPAAHAGGDVVVDVRGGNIIVSLAGSKYAVKHKPRNSAQLLARSLPAKDDRNASMTQGEFLALAWRAANAKAHELGWLR